MAHNAFSHLTPAEFKALYLTLQTTTTTMTERHHLLRDAAPGGGKEAEPDAATAVDWTARGAVTPVKNQERCGGCWAFAATGALEGALFLKTGKLVSLSEQMLVDCDTADSGCSGGSMESAFAWVGGNGSGGGHGLCAEAAYPYTAQTGKCRSAELCSPLPSLTKLSYVDVAASDAALTAALTEQPVAVGIEADTQGFQFYSSGVFSSSACGTNLDHGVLAVGFAPASVSTGVPAYYKLKNSWGPAWGEAGYVRVEKGGKAASAAGGMCGILTAASYPVLQ
jgi:C1A family cysteine protease